MKQTPQYTTQENTITKPKIIGFLGNWATTNEIITKGYDYNVTSYDKDTYFGHEAKSIARVISQDDDKTVVISELYIKDKDSDDEYLLDFKQKVTIKHYDSLENIKKEYENDLKYFNFLKNMLITNYNYKLVEENIDYDEFGLEDEILTSKKYRQASFSYQFNDDLTIREIKENIEDVLYYVKESLKNFENMSYTWHRYFDCNNKLCCMIEIYQVIK